MQGEYIRPELSQDWHAVFEESQQSIAKGMTEEKVPGLSIALVDREGLIWTAGFGHTDYDLKTPVTPDTIFSIQSMSKTFTATLVMLAVQEGLVDLDTPITEYLPDFKVKSRFEENPQDKMTLRHLLSHTAGFVHEAPVGNNYERKFPSYEAHIQSISDTWLKFPVGAKYSYSNLGIDLAAYIIQVKSGRSFAEYMKAKLLDPLGMPNSSVDVEFIRQHPNRAIGHTPHIERETLEMPMIGAGGVYTSATDLARFVQFHLNWGKVKGHSVLSKELIESMSTSSPGLCIGVNPHHIVSAERYPSIDVNDTNSCQLAHGGGGFGFLTSMSWYPEYGMGLLILTNSTNHNSQWELLKSLSDELMVKKLIERKYSAENQAWKTIIVENKYHPEYQKPDSDTFTRYKKEWKKYTGTYKYLTDWNLYTYARVALALGYPNPWNQVKVHKENGFLEANGERLDEHLPGVFFTDDGDCLDFSGPSPLWKGRRIKKK
jgi:CubicO group peptidase (beta-lactamase class C family)